MVIMRRLTLITAFSVGVLVAGVSFALPQQPSQTPSLGELARQLKAEHANEGAKPAKVFTNDNMPRSGSLTQVGSTAEADQGKTTKATGESGKGSEAKATSGTHDEKYYRDSMKELQSQREMHQRELAVLEQKLALNQTQYYADPNKTLNQEYSRSDITKKQDEIDKKKQQIADDEKAIADLEAQCQKEGCPPGWLR
jgi:hypothetical protein